MRYVTLDICFGFHAGHGEEGESIVTSHAPSSTPCLTTPHTTTYLFVTLLTYPTVECSSSTPTPPRRTRSSTSRIQVTNPAQDPDGEVVVATALAGMAVEEEEEEDLGEELDEWMMFEGRSVGAVVKMCDSS